MVKTRCNLVGHKFGRLTVLEQAEDGIQPNGQHRARWLCQCDCGSDPIVIYGYSLNRKNNTLSCGCLAKELVAERSIKNNIYDLSGEYGICYSSNTDEQAYFDLEDYELIKDYCWFVNNEGYMVAKKRGMNWHIFMHHIIFGKYCDHIDRNRLNNTKKNLRPATSSENSQNRSPRSDNTSGVTGVSFSTNENKWIAQVRLNGKKVFYKKYISKEDAIRARLLAEKQYFGEYAPQKHLYQQYKIN